MSAARTISLPDRPFVATVEVPGDKSLSHRALILSAMAEGTSEISRVGPGEDVRSTIGVLRSLGVTVGREGEGHVRVDSPGVDGWASPNRDLDCGNSGTTLRLMAGALAGRPFRTVLTGDASLRNRPMRRLVQPLEALGARIEVTGDIGTAPVAVGPSHGLHGARLHVPLASAQVRTAVSLAALQADSATELDGPAGFRDHTERWFETLGLGHRPTRTSFRVVPRAVPPASYPLPGDPSSAAFLWAAAAMLPGSRVTTPRVSLNAGRLGFLHVLEAFGAGVAAVVTGDVLGDPIGDVTIEGRPLAGTKVGGDLATAALDELPLVAVVASGAEGITVVRDAAELRTKESDRIETTVAMIQALGGGARATDDGFEIVGVGPLEPGSVESKGDHRIAMAAAVAAVSVAGGVTIGNADAVTVSWPGFYEALEGLWSSP